MESYVFRIVIIRYKKRANQYFNVCALFILNEKIKSVADSRLIGLGNIINFFEIL
jgi:hypothetical protein